MSRLSIFLLFSIVSIGYAGVAVKETAKKSTTTSTTSSTSTTRSSPSTATTTSAAESTTTFKPASMTDLLSDAHSWRNNVVDKHPECFEGDERSPINIDVVETVPAYFEPLKTVNYNATGKVFLNHHGGNFTNSIVGFSAWKNRPYIEGGGLSTRYNLEEVHLSINEYSTMQLGTWMGHSINGAHHTMEIHLVHVRQGLTMDQAMQMKGGISIVAVAVRTVFSWYGPHPGVSSALNRSIFPESDADTAAFDWIEPELLLPEDTTAFYRYNGSFAHPPCKPGVIWTVLVEPLTLSLTQFYSYLGNRESSTASLGHFMDEMPSRGNRVVQLNYGKHRLPTPEYISIASIPLRFPTVTLAIFLAAIAISITLVVLYFYRPNPKQNMGFDNIALEMPADF